MIVTFDAMTIDRYFQRRIIQTELNLGAVQPVVSVDALARSAVQRVCEELSLPEDAKLDCRPPCTPTAYI